MPRRSLVLLSLVALLVGGPAGGADFDVEYEKAAKTLLCDCGCHPQSIHDCSCGRAAELRADIANRVRSGASGDEVIAAFVAAKGEQIRIAPTATGFNLIAWLGPAILLLGATFGLFWVLRRWKGGPLPETTQGTAEIDPDDPYVSRLRDELERQS